LKHRISLTPNHAQNSSDFQDNFHSQKSRFKGGKITFHSLTKCHHSWRLAMQALMRMLVNRAVQLSDMRILFRKMLRNHSSATKL